MSERLTNTPFRHGGRRTLDNGKRRDVERGKHTRRDKRLQPRAAIRGLQPFPDRAWRVGSGAATLAAKHALTRTGSKGERLVLFTVTATDSTTGKVIDTVEVAGLAGGVDTQPLEQVLAIAQALLAKRGLRLTSHTQRRLYPEQAIQATGTFGRSVTLTIVECIDEFVL